jgi:hypothetical protein
MRQPAYTLKPTRAWLLAVVALLLVQGLYPRGFMPGSIEDGWPVVLCPSVWPAAFFSDTNRVDHHHHGLEDASRQLGATAQSEASDYCVLGGALDQQAVVSSVAQSTPATFTLGHQPSPTQTPAATAFHGHFLARAPPAA